MEELNDFKKLRELYYNQPISISVGIFIFGVIIGGIARGC